ncbi:MAG: hypothetical protein ACTSU5_06735 [Promethearchaeota archaeon]
MSPKPIEEMDRFDIQDEIEVLRKKKLWERSDEDNARLIALAHALEDLDGNIKYGEVDEQDFDDEEAKRQDEIDGPLDEYDGDEAGKKAKKRPAKKRAKKRSKKSKKSKKAKKSKKTKRAKKAKKSKNKSGKKKAAKKKAKKRVKKR